MVDCAAFVDKIVLSIGGKLKQHFDDELVHVRSTGILHPGTIYSRCVRGVFGESGNPVVFLYGKAKKFDNVPAMQIVMQSTVIPVTAAQSTFLIRKITQNAMKVTVSSLELTFDVTGVSVDYILDHLIHRARGGLRVLSKRRRKTIYVGSPRSKWQARIYQKRNDVVRLEFILRRSFLSRHGINQPEDVLLLRKLNIWNLLSIRRFSANSAMRVTKGWTENPWGRQIVRTWGSRDRPLAALAPILRDNKVHPNQVLRPTRLQRRLMRMQKRFVW